MCNRLLTQCTNFQGADGLKKLPGDYGMFIYLHFVAYTDSVGTGSCVGVSVCIVAASGRAECQGDSGKKKKKSCLRTVGD